MPRGELNDNFGWWTKGGHVFITMNISELDSLNPIVSLSDLQGYTT